MGSLWKCEKTQPDHLTLKASYLTELPEAFILLTTGLSQDRDYRVIIIEILNVDPTQIYHDSFERQSWGIESVCGGGRSDGVGSCGERESEVKAAEEKENFILTS